MQLLSSSGQQTAVGDEGGDKSQGPGMGENVRQILSKQRLDGPGVVDTDAKGACLLQHPEDLRRAHLLAGFSPVLAKAAAQVAPGIYAVRENERSSLDPHLPEGPGCEARRKASHNRVKPGGSFGDGVLCIGCSGIRFEDTLLSLNLSSRRISLKKIHYKY